MAGLCKVSLIGNLGRDPEKRYAQTGRALARFRVAATTRRRDRDGTWQDHTEWFNVTAFDRQAEALAERLAKGSRVYVEGRLESRTYDGQHGRGFALDVIAHEVVLLEARHREAEAGIDAVGAGERPEADAPAPAPSGGGLDDLDDLDDLPF